MDSQNQNQPNNAPLQAQPSQEPVTPSAAPAAPQQASQVTIESPKSSFPKLALYTFLLFSLSAVSYAGYVYKDTIISLIPINQQPSFSEDNFASSVLASYNKVQSAEYVSSIYVSVNPRDKDAVSMDSKLGPSPEKKAAYARDYARLRYLQLYASAIAFKQQTKLPATLKDATKDYGVYYSIGSKKQTYEDSTDDSIARQTGLSKSDLQSLKQTISYAVTANGTNFELKTTLETKEAADTLQLQMDQLKEREKSSSIPYPAIKYFSLENQTITITKDTAMSASYAIIPAEMKKPLLAQLGYSLKEFPSDVNINANIDVLNETINGLRLSLTGEGTFSDISYKLGISLIQKDNIIYYNISNFPLAFFSTPTKNKWVKILPPKEKTPCAKDDSECLYKQMYGDYGNTDYIGTMLSTYLLTLQKAQSDNIHMLQTLGETADKTKVIGFKNPPAAEKINNEKTTRYSIYLKKENLRAFVDEFKAETAQNATSSKTLADDVVKQVEDLLNSDDFDEVYDYTRSNLFLDIWTKQDGTPVKLQAHLRIVPSVDSKSLSDKQIDVTVNTSLTNINKSEEIKIPEDAKTYQEIMGTSTPR